MYIFFTVTETTEKKTTKNTDSKVRIHVPSSNQFAQTAFTTTKIGFGKSVSHYLCLVTDNKTKTKDTKEGTIQKEGQIKSFSTNAKRRTKWTLLSRAGKT